jgi:hypothetical protein
MVEPEHRLQVLIANERSDRLGGSRRSSRSLAMRSSGAASTSVLSDRSVEARARRLRSWDWASMASTRSTRSP